MAWGGGGTSQRPKEEAGHPCLWLSSTSEAARGSDGRRGERLLAQRWSTLASDEALSPEDRATLESVPREEQLSAAKQLVQDVLAFQKQLGEERLPSQGSHASTDGSRASSTDGARGASHSSRDEKIGRHRT